MKALVIAEKPSVGRDIARVLRCTKKINGGLEGGDYIITWAMGHLVSLAEPEEYNEKYKQWSMEYLPMLPNQFQLTVLKQTGKQYHAVKTLLYRKDIGSIIIATDAGREGELVARLILEKTNCKKPVRRLWISSVTDKAIKEGFAHLKDGREYLPLYDAAMSRAEADWLVGINATRALTCKYNAQLSCGRVQTPTLSMIAKREEEIKSFQPQSYYGAAAKSRKLSVQFTWQDARSKSYQSFQKERVLEVINQCRNQEGILTEVVRTPKKQMPPLLYDLTELQRDANKKFQFSAKYTLDVMQRLYENHKVLTYPRTDSRYLTADIVGTLKERLQAIAVGPYKKAAGKLFHKQFSTKEFFVNDSKVTDHHAIIPTEQFVQLDHMTVEERKIYDLVVKRFLAVLYPAFEYEQTTVTVRVGTELFAAKGKTVKNAGWKEVYENQEEEEEETELKEQFLPSMKKGDKITDLEFSLTEGRTKPPAPFNEATLLSAMENPVKYMENKDKELVKTLGETGGLGTVATRADIIEKLFHSFLLEKRGRDIYLTAKAKQLLKLVPSDLKKPELTADWEGKLSKIAKGSLKRNTFMEEIRNYTVRLTEEIKLGEGSFQHDNLTNKKCPECGKRLLLVKGKNSEMLVCQDRECGYRETISKTSNARCPVCHKKMELRGKGEAQLFVCVCGHKEKLEAFKKRRDMEGKGVSKKEVQNYLNKQKKAEQEPVNSAFADAFAKLNLK